MNFSGHQLSDHSLCQCKMLLTGQIVDWENGLIKDTLLLGFNRSRAVPGVNQGAI